ncbi:hypothetical protein LXL04_006810 [Taraxacum kok-saghyz]
MLVLDQACSRWENRSVGGQMYPLNGRKVRQNQANITFSGVGIPTRSNAGRRWGGVCVQGTTWKVSK